MFLEATCQQMQMEVNWHLRLEFYSVLFHFNY